MVTHRLLSSKILGFSERLQRFFSVDQKAYETFLQIVFFWLAGATLEAVTMLFGKSSVNSPFYTLRGEEHFSEITADGMHYICCQSMKVQQM